MRARRARPSGAAALLPTAVRERELRLLGRPRARRPPAAGPARPGATGRHGYRLASRRGSGGSDERPLSRGGPAETRRGAAEGQREDETAGGASEVAPRLGAEGGALRETGVTNRRRDPGPARARQA